MNAKSTAKSRPIVVSKSIAVTSALLACNTLVAQSPIAPGDVTRTNGQFMFGDVAAGSFPIELNVEFGTQQVKVVISESSN